MKNWLKNYGTVILILLISAVAIVLGVNLYKNNKDYELAMENSYNYAFYEFINYVDSMETYLSKSTISVSPEHGAETLTYVWREANLAETYLSQIPITTEGLSNASKFLNQVSDYSYALSRKNMENESLTQEDLDNLTKLHEYSVQLKNAVIELSEELNNGSISWSELTGDKGTELAQQVSNISQDSFDSIEGTFDDYTGLIYDGAFSEHRTSIERKGLTGEDISEEQAREVAQNFIGKDNIKEITSNGLSENGNIPSYNFDIILNNDEENNIKTISIAKKGGNVIYVNYNRKIGQENLSEDQAIEIATNFLNDKGYTNMKETYYLIQERVITINYAYEQEGVICYPDLIKIKIALDDGEILGFESTGYLNCHFIRNIDKQNIISAEEAKELINKNIEIERERLAIIPTEYDTEIYCWEIQGKVANNEFLVYINAHTGEEEDILVIINTPNGILTT